MKDDFIPKEFPPSKSNYEVLIVTSVNKIQWESTWKLDLILLVLCAYKFVDL